MWLRREARGSEVRVGIGKAFAVVEVMWRGTP